MGNLKRFDFWQDGASPRVRGKRGGQCPLERPVLSAPDTPVPCLCLLRLWKELNKVMLSTEAGRALSWSGNHVVTAKCMCIKFALYVIFIYWIWFWVWRISILRYWIVLHGLKRENRCPCPSLPPPGGAHFQSVRAGSSWHLFPDC